MRVTANVNLVIVIFPLSITSHPPTPHMPCFLPPCVPRLLCGDCHTALCVSSVQELLALSELAHYHLVRLYGVSANGSISIISEFVPGGPLDGYLQDNAASVSGGDMLSYAVQVAKVGGVGSWVGQGRRWTEVHISVVVNALPHTNPLATVCLTFLTDYHQYLSA